MVFSPHKIIFKTHGELYMESSMLKGSVQQHPFPLDFKPVFPLLQMNYFITGLLKDTKRKPTYFSLSIVSIFISFTILFSDSTVMCY